MLYKPGDLVRVKFNTRKTDATAELVTLIGTPAAAVYKDNSTVESTSGLTLTANFDGRVGMHHIDIDTNSNTSFYTAGSTFQVVLTAGTADGKAVANHVVGEFRLLDIANDVADAVHRGTVMFGAANTGATTTTIPIKSLSISLSVTNQVKGRLILFRTDTPTVALRGQGAPITSSTTTNIEVTDAFTTAPAVDDLFVIV